MMESIRSARHRMSLLPKLAAGCTSEASIYAKCVLAKENDIKLNDCAKEFDLFRTCIRKQAKNLKSRF